MPGGRFSGGGARRFMGRPWSNDLGRDLDEALNGLRDANAVLQGAPEDPEPVALDGTADPGDGQTPAAEDHVHTLATSAPANPTGKTAAQGSADSVLRSDCTVAQGIVSAKGDLLGHDGSTAERLPTAADDRVLMTAAAQTLGLIWNTVTALFGKLLTTKGDLATHNGTNAVRKGVGSDGQIIIADAAIAEGWKWASPTAAGGLVWTKYTVTHTQLQAAAMANDIELFSLPAAGVIHAVKIKHSTLFAGTGITDYKLSVGIGGTLTKYAGAFDVDTAVSDTNFQTSSVVGAENHGATASIRLAATSTGANLDQSTAGAVNVWVLTSIAV